MRVLLVIVCMIMVSCNNTDNTSNNKSNSSSSIELLNDIRLQGSIFRDLITVTQNAITETVLNDSLAFLILPVQASCPSCRGKTIDSIVKYQSSLAVNHFIIISANGGRKTINSYFRDKKSELPEITGKLFLDTTNQAAKYELYDKKPTIYYTYRQMAYKKVAAVPSTVKQDLQEFFSGTRNSN